MTCPAGPYTYSGVAQTPCSVTVTGAGGLNLSPTADYTDNINAGTATASYTYRRRRQPHRQLRQRDLHDRQGRSTTSVHGAPATTSSTTARPHTAHGSCAPAPGETLDRRSTCHGTTNTDAGDCRPPVVVRRRRQPQRELRHRRRPSRSTRRARSRRSTCPAGPSPTTASPRRRARRRCTGAGGLNQAPTARPTRDNTNAGTATASYTYRGRRQPHRQLRDSATRSTIDKAELDVTTVTCPANVDLRRRGPRAVHRQRDRRRLARTSTADGRLHRQHQRRHGHRRRQLTGDANHNGSAAPRRFTIDKAPSTTTVTCPAGPYTYSGIAQEPCSAIGRPAPAVSVRR